MVEMRSSSLAHEPWEKPVTSTNWIRFQTIAFVISEMTISSKGTVCSALWVSAVPIGLLTSYLGKVDTMFAM